MTGGATGGKITRIEVQRKSRQRVNLYLDDHFALSLSSVVVERAALRPGILLSSDDISRLTRQDSTQRALDTALSYLSHRPRSQHELRRNLTRKGLAPELIDQAVDRLTELNLLDDAAFAKYWGESRDRFNPRGKLALRYELQAKGVARETIDRAVAGGDDDEVRARSLVEKRLPHLRDLDYLTFQQRISSLLARRGFSYEIARRVAQNVWAVQDSAAPDEITADD